MDKAPKIENNYNRPNFNDLVKSDISEHHKGSYSQGLALGIRRQISIHVKHYAKKFKKFNKGDDQAKGKRQSRALELFF